MADKAVIAAALSTRSVSPSATIAGTNNNRPTRRATMFASIIARAISGMAAGERQKSTMTAAAESSARVQIIRLAPGSEDASRPFSVTQLSIRNGSSCPTPAVRKVSGATLGLQQNLTLYGQPF
jgi:hypothetical protein